MKLNYVVHEGDGPYCLCVHGALGSRSYWADNVEALGSVCRPVMIELWGHGRSPAPADQARYEPEALVADFEQIRIELDADRLFTIGQSMGAALTLRYGLTHPERVIAQVITNSSSAFSKLDGWLERNLEMVRPLADQVEAEGVEVLRDLWVNPGRSRRIRQEVRDLMAVEFDEHTPLGIANSLRFTNAGLPLGERTRDVAHPTLLTNGTGEENFQKLLRRVREIPGIEIVDIDANHAVNAQNPAAWNAAVVEFFGRPY